MVKSRGLSDIAAGALSKSFSLRAAVAGQMTSHTFVAAMGRRLALAAEHDRRPQTGQYCALYTLHRKRQLTSPHLLLIAIASGARMGRPLSHCMAAGYQDTCPPPPS